MLGLVLFGGGQVCDVGFVWWWVGGMFVLGGGFVISCMIRARWVDVYSVPGFLEFLGVVLGCVDLGLEVGLCYRFSVWRVVGVNWSWWYVGFTCFLFGLGLGWCGIVF